MTALVRVPPGYIVRRCLFHEPAAEPLSMTDSENFQASFEIQRTASPTLSTKTAMGGIGSGESR